MKLTRIFATIFALSLIPALAQAASVTGTVTDRTTGKPASGDAVVLVEPMSGMSEVGNAKTDAQGKYTLSLPGANPYLIRVTHQGADYFVSVPQGGGPADVSVYDVAPKVDGVSIDEHVIGVETDNGQLRVVERYTVRNASTPPRTQWSKRSFEIVLPTDAVLGDVSAQRAGAGSLPTTVKLDPAGQKGHFSFDFPIQPDEGGKGTLFQVQYTVPYSGNKYTFHSVVTIPAHTFWIVLPKSMTFTGAGFESSPQDPTVQTFMMREAAPNKTYDYTISGTGSFPREDQGAQSGMQGGTVAMGGQPGGGIGQPINTPDPLSRYKWWILGGLALLLAAAAAFLLRKPAGVPATPVAATATIATPSAPAAPGTSLLNALKEELFALESDKIAGKLSDAEYAEQKAALETVLKRALKRS